MDAGPPGSAWRSAPSGGWSDRMDGRLDLDNLDDDAPLDLDVLSDEDDGPGWLERSGVAPWARRHPALATTAVVALAAVVVAPSVVQGLSPKPVSDVPLVSVTTGGNEDARLTLDPETGHVTEISQLVLVTSSEPPDVAVQALGVTGPGLTDPRSRVMPATADAPTTGAVRSSVDCTAPDATTTVIAADARDYQVALRLTSSSTGEVRETQVPLAGAEEWLADIRRACVQVAADRDLAVVDVDATPVADNVAADVRVLVRSTASQPWKGVHVSTTGGPTVVAAGPPTDVPAGGEAWVATRLWPDDCANPTGPLAAGVPLRAALGDQSATTEARSPTFRLALDRTAIDQVARTLQAVCRGQAPTMEVERARVSIGGSDSSAGSIDVWLRLTSADGSLVEVIDPLSADEGRVIPLRTTVPLVDGAAELKVRWQLPQCFDLLQQGAPVLRVRVVSDLRRPYAVTLRGEPLRENLQRLCGTTVAGSVR